MSDVTIIKVVIIIVLLITNAVVGVVSYHHGYSDCLDDFDRWITELNERRK